MAEDNVSLGIMPTKIAKVAVDHSNYSFDKLYDYLIPVQWNDVIKNGVRVLVPFGRGNRKRLGFVFEIVNCNEQHEPVLENNNKKNSPYFTKTGYNIKPIFNIIDNEKIITDEMLKMVYWIKEHMFCSFFDAIKIMIPSGLNIKFSTKYKIKNYDIDNLTDDEKFLVDNLSKFEDNKSIDDRLMGFAINENYLSVINSLIQKGIVEEKNIFKQKIQDQKFIMVRIFDNMVINNLEKLTSKQKKVVKFLLDAESASVKEIEYLCGVTKSVLDNLVEKKIIEYFEIDKYRNPYQYNDDCIETNGLEMNDAQKNVIERLKGVIAQNKPNISLLYGVTGSGKTMVFIDLIKYVIDRGKTAIMLVPEISLISQMVNVLQKYFGNDVAILHSGLTVAQRFDEWKRIKNKLARIVLGTRSAIFAPVENLGLIIIDEEQENSYKSESAPRYHVREIAQFRTVYNGALMLMASATPSVETYYKIKKNNFNILELNKRYNDKELPQVFIIDMKQEVKDGNHTFFSRRLISELEKNLCNKEQSIVFINRRGYNTVVRCSECGKVELCPNCSIALTYHKVNDSLMCHYCGYVKESIKNCSICDSNYIQYGGIGTQKIENQLETMFPDAKILRMDSDTTITKFSYDRFFNEFLEQKYDILIGTQMIAKGLNFPNVTLVGVIDADQSMYSSDYKGVEKTYDIITQVIGRSGRGNITGRAVVQTHSKDNEIFQIIKNQDYNEFYNKEIMVRKQLLYPPFCDLCMIGIVGLNEKNVLNLGNKIFSIIKNLVFNKYSDIPIKMLGPTPDDVLKINNKFRYKIILKHKDNLRYRQMIRECLDILNDDKYKRDVRVFIDKL